MVLIILRWYAMPFKCLRNIRVFDGIKCLLIVNEAHKQWLLELIGLL